MGSLLNLATPLHEATKRDYRAIPLDAILTLSTGGEKYEVR